MVERDDWEGPTGRTRPLAPPGFGFIPESVRSRVRRVLVAPLRRRKDRASEFCRAALAFARHRHPETADLPSMTADVSLAETCDFGAFLRHVAGAAVIVTTRLHVAILGQLLAIPTYLVEGLRGKSQALSVTFWSDEASAVRYEASGRFDELASLLRPYLSGLYQWRLSLAPAGEARDLKGTDLTVSGFHVVAGRRLRAPGSQG